MSRLSRRTLLAAGAAAGATITFSEWMSGQAWARAPGVRRSLTSAGGAADLQKYAQAVQLMMARAEADPRGWMFWWYIHQVRGDRTKAAELNRVFPAPSPARTLAQLSWSTCQAHNPGDVEDYFLPWHRMYVFFLEAVMRNLLNDPSFNLPYWNYIDPAQRALPQPFRVQGAALYRPNRNAGSNAGQPIDQGLNPTPINANAMNQTEYRASGGQQGFNMNLDFNLHGSVHVRVGNNVGMGSVPWAAQDPIFWMHHCQIDRLWASWNKNGGCNPADSTWLNKTFVFPDGQGNQVVAKIGDFTSIAPLYSYDSYQTGPKILCKSKLLFNLKDIPVLHRIPRPFPVPPEGAEVALQTVARPQRGLLSARGGRRTLVLQDLAAQTSPGVLYAVTVRANEKSAPVTVGHIHFFGAAADEHERHDPSGHAGHGDGSDRFFSFDVTRALGRGDTAPLVGLRPVGAPNAAAKPVVGDVRVVQD